MTIIIIIIIATTIIIAIIIIILVMMGDRNYCEVERRGGSAFDDAHLARSRLREPQICEYAFSALEPARELARALAPTATFAEQRMQEQRIGSGTTEPL